MNYQYVHDKIIERARNRPKPDGYCERHHVLPRSMGGSDEAENLVLLTGREHYLIHWLLYRIHRNPPMAFAWERMSHGRDAVRRYTSHTFVYAKRAKAAAIAKLFVGQKLSAEHRAKLRAAKLGRTYADMGRDPSTSRKGVKLTPEQRARVAEASRGRKHSPEARRKLSAARQGPLNPNFGKETDLQTRERIAASLRANSKDRKGANLLTINGLSDTVAAWARHPACSVGAATIYARKRDGWADMDAVFTPAIPQRERGRK